MIFSDPYKNLVRFRKGTKAVPMPPGHGRLLERLRFERDYINKRLTPAKYISEQLSLEAMVASRRHIERTKVV